MATLGGDPWWLAAGLDSSGHMWYSNRLTPDKVIQSRDEADKIFEDLTGPQFKQVLDVADTNSIDNIQTMPNEKVGPCSLILYIPSQHWLKLSNSVILLQNSGVVR